MPCSYDGHSDSAVMREELDNVTSMLCELCAYVEEYGADGINDLPERVFQWWRAHKEADQRRLEAERAELAKLHREELREYERLKLKLKL